MAQLFQKDMELYGTGKDYYLCEYSNHEAVTQHCSEPYPELATIDVRYVHPIVFGHWCAMHNPVEADKFMEYLEDSDTFALHGFGWLEESFNILLEELDAPVMKFARKTCPLFYQHRMQQREILNLYRPNMFP